MITSIDKEKVVPSRAWTPAATTRSVAFDRIADLARTFGLAARRTMTHGSVAGSLARLDDRMLADIGVQRWQIDAVADRSVADMPTAGKALRKAGMLIRDLLFGPFVAWYRRQVAYNDLMSLDAHMLRDIGISRSDIPLLVRNVPAAPAAAMAGAAAQTVPGTARLWQHTRRAIKELKALDDRMLRDIGVMRCDIPVVAEEMALRALQIANGNEAPRAA